MAGRQARPQEEKLKVNPALKSEEPGGLRQGAEPHVQREAQGERVLQTPVTKKSDVVFGG